ncbi:MAG: hypothetical protein Q4D89_11650 [Arachnia propionica]|nr:hypothetical protein [Arachnia propionica]
MSGPRKWLLRIGIAVIALVLIAAAGLVVIARAPPYRSMTASCDSRG